MKKRAAIELSANFLVVIIIAVVILSLSFALFKNILNKTGKTTDVLDERIKKQIENLLLNSGERVVLPINRGETSPNGALVFGLGVTNVLGHDDNFYVHVRCDTDPALGLDCSRVQVKGIDLRQDVQIKNTERKIFEIVLDFQSADRVTYVFNVDVCRKGTATTTTAPITSNCYSGYPYFYGRKYKIYANVD